MRRLAIGVAVAALVLAAAAMWLGWLGIDTEKPSMTSAGSGLADIALPLIGLAFIVPGLFIALRLPRHSVAWCFLAMGLSRSRMQQLIDRRFYRTRYDASRAIDAFSVRLRGDVDLDSVHADLISVVDETIHPAHATMWLRGATR